MLQALERLHSGIGGVCILDASNDFAALLHNLFVRLVLLGVCSYFLGGLAVVLLEQLGQEVVLAAGSEGRNLVDAVDATGAFGEILLAVGEANGAVVAVHPAPQL